MKKFLSSKKRKAILATAALSVAAVPSYSAASYTEYSYYNGTPFAEMEIYEKGDGGSGYTISPTLVNAIKVGASYWTDMLGAGASNSTPWQIIIKAKLNEQNAFAGTQSFNNREEVSDNYAVELIQGMKTFNPVDMKLLTAYNFADENDGNDIDEYNETNAIKNYLPEGYSTFSTVTIGQYFGANRAGAIEGWTVDADTVLTTNEQAADFVGTIRHELGHALGLGKQVDLLDANGNIAQNDNSIFVNSDKTFRYRFAKDITNPNAYSLHLIDQNGRAAKPGMFIVTTNTLNDLKSQDPNLDESNYFVVDRGNYAYFIGDHVSEVLNGATFNGVKGIPINGWELHNNGINYIFEGSHLQTAGMMSHRTYTNYTSFMEAELALMQDLGYNIDRKAYYGYSVYRSNDTIYNTNGYSARNSDGTAYLENVYSTVPLGVGLHVYGSHNDITQAANILTNGTAAVGIRVDGEGNTINVPSSTEIHADGYRGKGILFAYGRNQNLNQYGTVTARGQGGNAIEFNFGSSSNGARDEYRGSYIRYAREVQEGTGLITKALNIPLKNDDVDSYNASPDELNGELITNYNLWGNIVGSENAIYIGKNALVKNINVNEGASIIGNITSDWKHFSEEDGIYSTFVSVTTLPLMTQYNGIYYLYTRYIPDLVTNLNFNNTMYYSGNITGSDNIKMNVNSGSLLYDGVANVINVNVANGAGLFGGTYTVNDLSSRLAAGFSDDTTGKFYNHGIIGAYSPDKTMTINGTLISDGVISGYYGGSRGNVVVNGAANLDGTTIAATNILPGESMNVLTAQSISGNLKNASDYTAISGMLSAKADINGNTVKVTTKAANNLGEISSEQLDAYNAVTNMNNLLSGSQPTSLRTIYGLDADSAKATFSRLGSNDSSQMMSIAQKSSVVNRVISDRMGLAFNQSADLLSDSSVDNNAWIKYTKSWGSLNGGADYHGQGISGGYDHAIGENWRTGFFVSYNASGYAQDASSGNVYDTRFGIYGGYKRGADEGFIYLDGGKIRNKLQRGLGAVGLMADAKYDGTIFEIGGEYKRDLQPERTWHVSPYINLQFSNLKQDSYSEDGAGIFNQHVDGKHNSYFAGQIGLELKRKFTRGNYAARFGVKHAFTGADPELSFSYEGDGGTSYTLKNNQDKTHFILSLSGENEFARGWIIGGDLAWQKGAHDKDLSASFMLRKIW